MIGQSLEHEAGDVRDRIVAHIPAIQAFVRTFTRRPMMAMISFRKLL